MVSWSSAKLLEFGQRICWSHGFWSKGWILSHHDKPVSMQDSGVQTSAEACFQPFRFTVKGLGPTS